MPRRPETPPTTDADPASAADHSGDRRLDPVLLLAFFGLVFLLGVFPLKDTDFWWHLRTGDLIRQGKGVPQTDWYTFGAEGHPWIDLHWGFQVLLSLGYQLGGVRALNLAKCAITVAAVTILVVARPRPAPLWATLLAWLPALAVLSGRMYVRPETLTLLYLAIFLGVLARWRDYPRLLAILPIVQVLWVNTQGLFVFGPVVLGMAWIDAALERGAFAPERRPAWRRLAGVTALVGVACLVNPYGLRGAMYPLALAGTMNNPIFSHSIAELMPVISLDPSDEYSFIEQSGVRSLPLQLHLATMVLGGLSFVLPILWRARVRPRGQSETPAPRGGGRRERRRSNRPARPPEPWHLSTFRLLLYLAFSFLSLKATRNSHQFAAVVGAVTAWNFGTWAGAIRAQRAEQKPSRGLAGPVTALASIVVCAALVGSGLFYRWAGEGRTIGLGEEPLWFPHAAARFAGRPELPPRFVCFHNGLSAVYTYHNGPDRKVYTDARLEVMGPDLYARYLNLQRQISEDRPGWSEALRALGDPGVMVDNVQVDNAATTASLLAHPDWACVWFDPIATVFVLSSSPAARVPFDFAARHFRPDPVIDPSDARGLRASARALYQIAMQLGQRAGPERAQPLLLLAVGQAHRARALEPNEPEGWKLLGLIESIREPLGSVDEPVARFRQPFDPVFDLSPARASYALRRALAELPDDTMSLLTLASSFQSRGMFQEALPLYTRLALLDPPGRKRWVVAQMRQLAKDQAARCLAELGREPMITDRNLAELDASIQTLLDSGRPRTAAELIERSVPAASRSWAYADQLGTLWLHLGEPARARAAWTSARNPPRPALVEARVASSYLAEDDFATARQHYRAALAIEPNLFEALYGLAVLERDNANARESVSAAERAVAAAPSDTARTAAQSIRDLAIGVERER